MSSCAAAIFYTEAKLHFANTSEKHKRETQERKSKTLWAGIELMTSRFNVNRPKLGAIVASQ